MLELMKEVLRASDDKSVCFVFGILAFAMIVIATFKYPAVPIAIAKGMRHTYRYIWHCKMRDVHDYKFIGLVSAHHAGMKCQVCGKREIWIARRNI